MAEAGEGPKLIGRKIVTFQHHLYSTTPAYIGLQNKLPTKDAVCAPQISRNQYVLMTHLKNTPITCTHACLWSRDRCVSQKRLSFGLRFGVLRRTQALRDRRIRITIWCILIALGGLIFFCFHPISWKQDAHVLRGATITLDSASDFLIVVDYQSFNPSPEKFQDMSFSLAWLNTFQQEIGPVSPVFRRSLTLLMCVTMRLTFCLACEP